MQMLTQKLRKWKLALDLKIPVYSFSPTRNHLRQYLSCRFCTAILQIDFAVDTLQPIDKSNTKNLSLDTIIANRLGRLKCQLTYLSDIC